MKRLQHLEAVLADAFPETRSKPQPKQSTTFADKDEFLAAMTPVAKEVAEDLGISHKIVLAQAALESGWGSKVKRQQSYGYQITWRGGRFRCRHP